MNKLACVNIYAVEHRRCHTALRPVNLHENRDVVNCTGHQFVHLACVFIAFKYNLRLVAVDSH